jgi:hypothetical protein
VKTGVPVPSAFTEGSQWGFWVCVGVSIAGLVATILFVRDSELARAPEEAAATA